MNFFYRFTLLCFYAFFKIFYRHQVFGSSHFGAGPAIIAPNHASFWDPPIVAASAPEEVYFLARSSLFDNPFLRLIISHLNAYPVTGTAQDLHSFKIICSLLNEQKKMTIFPEGIRTYDGNFSSIKSGVAMLALRCNCPIIPTYIAGTFGAWPRQRRFPRLFGKTACVFGSPIYPQDFLHLHKKEAQVAMTACLCSHLEKLRHWYHAGAEGSPP